MNDKHYDFIAVGLGPFNLGLACLTAPLQKVDAIFLEQNSEFDWHPGLMLDGVHLQTPFLSDLVTMADPTNPFSFLNYMKETGRLYQFYIRENFFILRKEYNLYCQWASKKLNSIRFNVKVTNIVYNEQSKLYSLTTINSISGESKVFKAKKLVLGTGPTPHIPVNTSLDSKSAIHSKDYIQNIDYISNQGSVTLIGSGQSAAEIFYDLLNRSKRKSISINWITRSNRFFPLEYTKLTLELTSPDYLNYFFNLEQNARNSLNVESRPLYKGINATLINEIYDALYEKSLDGGNNIQILSDSTLQNVIKLKKTTNTEKLRITFKHNIQDASYELDTDFVIFATGFQYQIPPYLSGLSSRIRWNVEGLFNSYQHYAIDLEGTDIFVQNAEFNTHGFITPDLGMGCYRNSIILSKILGYSPYPIEESIAFQTFGVPNQRNEIVNGTRCHHRQAEYL